MEKKNNKSMHQWIFLVKCIFFHVYWDLHISVSLATSKQSTSAGHSWRCLSVLSLAKEREDIKSISLSLKQILTFISSDANADDIVEAANILTTK